MLSFGIELEFGGAWRIAAVVALVVVYLVLDYRGRHERH